jgi:DNA invertase Pin-like site-specific DNA recombinase
MGKSVVFLAQSKFSPSIADQRAKCAGPDDEVILAGDVRFTDLVKATVRNKHTLRSGDRLKLYDLNSLILATGSLVRLLTRLLRSGVTIEICSEGLEIKPDAGDAVFRALTLLDNQQRAVHAVRTHGPDVKTGRKAVLKDEQWAEIRALLADKKQSPTAVATQYGVGRTTLFNFIRRMKAADGSGEKAVD